MMKKLKVSFLLGLLVICVAFSGCGKDEDTNQIQFIPELELAKDSEHYLSEGLHFSYRGYKYHEGDRDVIIRCVTNSPSEIEILLSNAQDSTWCILDCSSLSSTGIIGISSTVSTYPCRISVKGNYSFEERHAEVIIRLKSGEKEFRFPITQEKSEKLEITGNTWHVLLGYQLDDRSEFGTIFWGLDKSQIDSLIIEGVFDSRNDFLELNSNAITIWDYLDLSQVVIPYIKYGYDLSVPIKANTIPASWLEKTKTKEIILPDKLVVINEKAFAQSQVSLIKIPNSVNTIGKDVFWDCDGLTSIVLPEDLTQISSTCFFSCDNLKTIHMKSTNPPLITDGSCLYLYSEMPIKVTLYVPAGCEEAYKNSSWAQNAIEIIGE